MGFLFFFSGIYIIYTDKDRLMRNVCHQKDVIYMGEIVVISVPEGTEIICE